MKTKLCLAIVALSLAGCQMITHKETAIPTNKNITLDMKYLNPTSMSGAVKEIQGYGVDRSKTITADNNGIDCDVYLSNYIYVSKKNGDLNFSQYIKDAGDGVTLQVDSFRSQFTENTKGVYTSHGATMYQWNIVDPLSNGVTLLKPDSEIRKVTAYPVEKAIDNLKNTYSMVKFDIKSEYSPESVQAQLTRELKAQELYRNTLSNSDQKAFIANFKLSEQSLPISFTVEPYKLGSIVIAKAGVPVKVAGETFTYGSNTEVERVKSFVKKVLDN